MEIREPDDPPVFPNPIPTPVTYPAPETGEEATVAEPKTGWAEIPPPAPAEPAAIESLADLIAEKVVSKLNEEAIDG